eukprot:gene4032-20207_t
MAIKSLAASLAMIFLSFNRMALFLTFLLISILEADYRLGKKGSQVSAGPEGDSSIPVDEKEAKIEEIPLESDACIETIQEENSCQTSADQSLQRVEVISDNNRIFTLVKDEMSLKLHHFNNGAQDSIFGFETLGDGKTSSLVANCSLVRMARGVLENCKQPVAYYFVNEACSSAKLEIMVDEALVRLETTGLNVVGVQEGNSDNPTSNQFKSAYRKLLHANLLTVSAANCEQDENELLAQLSYIRELPEVPVVEKLLKIISIDYSNEQVENKVFKDNAMAYVAGYLLCKTYSKHKCEKCSVLSNNNESQKVFLMLKAYESSS